ncbi:hypothetical protein J5J10_09125 [Ciceribacter sp. L1K23]|uniref:DUF4344 domain-containing metallopeptidase n=1 Tax=Ciceribacter sp. L1K23 TaxID=2820276 RepID=UPI001B815351|nr:DUF4344 domain-containing metallopeptidase [Ciceribacter sp. L1K23]MBR0555840.1 hypothetical protein [Ciceribacter sp. L1K23]
MNRTLLLLATLASLIGAPRVATAQEINLDDFNEAETQEAIDFVVGNAMFVLIHEAGHMLISELGLPVLGREEDAVDALSSILMLELRDENFDRMITDSADGWFLSSDRAEEAGEELAFWDSHGLDRQRAYQMICMMVGHDAEGFKEFADSMDFPDDRREECTYEYAAAATSWLGLLSPHMTEGTDGAKFKVSYETPKDESLVLYAELLKQSGVLEMLQSMIGDSFKLNDGIRVTGKACGQPNAFWHPAEREITYCYELAQYHMGLIAQWLVDQREQ